MQHTFYPKRGSYSDDQRANNIPIFGWNLAEAQDGKSALEVGTCDGRGCCLRQARDG